MIIVLVGGVLDNATSSSSSSSISGDRRKSRVFFSLKRGKWRENCNHVVSEQLQLSLEVKLRPVQFVLFVVQFLLRKQ